MIYPYNKATDLPRKTKTMTKFKLDPKKKKQWIDALRSGEYEQGTGALCEKLKDGTYLFCCLGVYANEFISEPWEFKHNAAVFKQNTAVFKHGDGKYDTDLPSEEIPVEVQKDLIELNDDNLADFYMISNWIDENL